jgi:hypothetical protein
MIGNFLAVLNFNWLFLELNRFICSNCQFSPIIVLDVDLTQNRETTALRTLTTVGLFYFIMCNDPYE